MLKFMANEIIPAVRWLKTVCRDGMASRSRGGMEGGLENLEGSYNEIYPNLGGRMEGMGT